ncbi:MAG: glucosyl transferase, partial [Ignavibacteriales bacterium CG_4_9_14_3_um_filter_30_11]
WSKIESGTSLNIYDIRGDYDFQTNQKEILAIGSDVGTGNGSIIEKINNNSASQLSSEAIVGNATTIWFLSDRAYYVGSGKAYYKHKLNDSNWHPLIGLTRYTITSIDGNDINDVFFTSSGGDIVHFNGVSFKSYLDQIRMSQIIYSSIKTKGNLAIAVGFLDARAVITIGKRSD